MTNPTGIDQIDQAILAAMPLKEKVGIGNVVEFVVPCRPRMPSTSVSAIRSNGQGCHGPDLESNKSDPSDDKRWVRSVNEWG